MKPIYMYAIGIIILIAFAVYTIAISSNFENKQVVPSSGGDIQKIVIGIKNGNYYPNTITVKAGQPVSISLDNSVVGCYRGFVIRDFGINKYLRTPQDTVEFTPTVPGTYRFQCTMGMGRGTLIVE